MTRWPPSRRWRRPRPCGNGPGAPCGSRPGTARPTPRSPPRAASASRRRKRRWRAPGSPRRCGGRWPPSPSATCTRTDVPPTTCSTTRQPTPSRRTSMANTPRHETPAELPAEALRERIAGCLITARERTELLTGSVDEADLVRQHSPLMSPLVWDLAHIANQEELWLLREVGGREPMHPEIDPLYDAFQHSRASRPSLPLLGPSEARAYVREVRDKVLDVLDGVPLSGQP